MMHKKAKTLIIALLLSYFTLLFLLRSPPKAPPVVISHRGAAALAPENTLVAIEEGIKQGAFPNHAQILVRADVFSQIYEK